MYVACVLTADSCDYIQDEISDIVAQRRSHEVALSKRDVKPVDYLRYIEYEKKLERLRKSRASRLREWTNGVPDLYGMLMHVCVLFLDGFRNDY